MEAHPASPLGVIPVHSAHSPKHLFPLSFKCSQQPLQPPEAETHLQTGPGCYHLCSLASAGWNVKYDKYILQVGRKYESLKRPGCCLAAHLWLLKVSTCIRRPLSSLSTTTRNPCVINTERWKKSMRTTFWTTLKCFTSQGSFLHRDYLNVFSKYFRVGSSSNMNNDPN